MTDLKIEAGKCYETRDGRKAYVLGERHERGPNRLNRFVGYIADCPPCAWGADGSNGIYPEDLISEWKEPRKGEVWVTVSKHGVLDELVVSAHEYPVPSDRRCLAILGPIPWTEGQGLDGEGSE